MNREAEKHLDRAEKYLGKGEEFYRKVAAEIAAAQAADTTLSNREVARRLGRSESWVRKIVTWSTTASDGRTLPYSDDTPRRQDDMARQVLRDAPLEQVERIISDLPFERQQAVAAAAGNRYAQARQDYDEKERRMTPAQQKEREAAVASVSGAAARMTAGFDHLAVANHLEQATDLVREIIEHGTGSAEMLPGIDAALGGFLDEYRVLQATIGQEAAR